jgi:hypothetical protein
MTSFYAFSILIVGLGGLALVLVSTEIGWRIGVRVKAHSTNTIAALLQILFGLLALMVGFTFAMALTRFEARRDAVVNEANAVGTTALRARFLPEPHRAETLKLLREYVQIRIDYIQGGRSLAEHPEIIQRSNEIQEALWQQAKAVAAKDNAMVPTGIFIQTLNEMIDDQGKRLAALRNTIPNVLLATLFGITAIAGAIGGYATGLDRPHTRLPVYIVVVMVCAVIFVILDLDRPNVGFIRISHQPMVDTAASIAAFSD